MNHIIIEFMNDHEKNSKIAKAISLNNDVRVLKSLPLTGDYSN